MSREKYNSDELENARIALNNNVHHLSDDEKLAYQQGRLVLKDMTLVLKSAITTSIFQELISNQVNKEFREGINDFQDARIVANGIGGSFVCTRIRVMFKSASTINSQTNTDPANEFFAMGPIPADLANGELRLKRNNLVERPLKLQHFSYPGDAPQDLEKTWFKFEEPLVLARKGTVGADLVRPTGVIVPDTAMFISIEYRGYQLAPVEA